MSFIYWEAFNDFWFFFYFWGEPLGPPRKYGDHQKKYFFSKNKNLNFVPSQSQCAMKIRMFAKKSRSIGRKLTNLRPFQNLKKSSVTKIWKNLRIIKMAVIWPFLRVQTWDLAWRSLLYVSLMEHNQRYKIWSHISHKSQNLGVGTFSPPPVLIVGRTPQYL